MKKGRAVQKLVDRKTAVLMVLCIVGFGLLQGARLIDSNSGPYSGQEFALFGLAVDGATFLVVAVLSYFQVVERPEPLFLIGVAAMAVYLVLGSLGVTSVPLQLVMQAAAGMGWSLTILCWMAVFVAYRPRFSLVMIALSYVVDVATFFLASQAGMLSHGLLTVVLVVSLVMLLVCIRYRADVAQGMRESLAPAATLAEAFSKARRATAGAFAFSLVCGFVIESDRLLTGLDYAQSSLTSFICLCVAAFMVVYLAVFRVRKANVDYISPLATLCIAVALLFRSLGVGGEEAAGSIMTSTLITFYVLLWLMLISEAYERMLPGFFLLGLALGVARLSVGLGRLLSRWMEATLGLDGNLVVIAALVFLAVATSLVFLGYLHSTSAKKRAGAVLGEEDVEDAGMLDEGGAAVSDGREAGRKGVVHANVGHAGAGHAHGRQPGRAGRGHGSGQRARRWAGRCGVRAAGGHVWPLRTGGGDRARILVGPERALHSRLVHAFGIHGEDAPEALVREDGHPFAAGTAGHLGRDGKPPAQGLRGVSRRRQVSKRRTGDDVVGVGRSGPCARHPAHLRKADRAAPHEAARPVPGGEGSA